MKEFTYLEIFKTIFSILSNIQCLERSGDITTEITERLNNIVKQLKLQKTKLENDTHQEQ